MEMHEIKKEINQIEMPEDMKKRILQNCHENKRKEMQMDKRNRSKMVYRRPLPAAAAILVCLCLCLTGITVMAATGNLQGYFKDVFNLRGAVTGTTYEQATNEVEIRAEMKSDNLEVSVDFLNPNAAPYSDINALSIEEYDIMDGLGNKILEQNKTESFEIADGSARILISMEKTEIPEGNYKIVIREITGSKKGDQPLPIKGTWEAEFTK